MAAQAFLERFPGFFTGFLGILREMLLYPSAQRAKKLSDSQATLRTTSGSAPAPAKRFPNCPVVVSDPSTHIPRRVHISGARTTKRPLNKRAATLSLMRRRKGAEQSSARITTATNQPAVVSPEDIALLMSGRSTGDRKR